MSLSYCAKCGAPVFYMRHPDSGRLTPVDAGSAKPGDTRYDKAKGHRLHFPQCRENILRQQAARINRVSTPVKQP